MFIADCDSMFQIKRQSWEMKNFVPREKPEVPLLMSAVEQRLSAGNARTSDDVELDEMCNGLLGDDQPQLSPLTIIDKSALVVDSILGMSHDIDDVVDSVINDDDLPPLADLSELAVLPPPSLPPAAVPTMRDDESVESRLMPKLLSSVSGLTYVNNEPAVLVRLRRLDFHGYCSPDVVDTSLSSSSCVQSLNVTSVSGAACKSTSDLTSNGHVSVKQEPIVSTSKQLQSGSFVTKTHKSVSVKRRSSSEKSQTSVVKSVVPTSTVGCVDDSRHVGCVDDSRHRQSPVVVLTDLSAECVSAARSKVKKSQQPVCASQSSSVKRKSNTASDLCSTKKQRADPGPTPDINKLWYVMSYICYIAAC